ncbi:MAG: TIGR02757 family protein [Thermovirgaceae bacterium]|nr:TIGR02757 family protein [Thermovirgaceae bacterium]
MRISGSELCRKRAKVLFVHFEEMYRCYNRPEYVDPDPVSVVRAYCELPDREVAAVISSCLAYGRAAQIVKSVRAVLGPMGDSPARFIRDSSQGEILNLCEGFRHRFTDSRDLYDLLISIRGALRLYGSIETVFSSGLKEGPNGVMAGLSSLSLVLRAASGDRKNSLLPDIVLGSACKRYHLFLKWMVRNDGIDPGGWTCIAPAELMIPLDTHMHRICLELGLIRRKAADMGAVIEATESFRLIAPEDPTRYDFTLTRFGIRPDLKVSDLIEQCSGGNV